MTLADQIEALGAKAEVIARIIDPSSWDAMDSYLRQAERKYARQKVSWPVDQFKHKESMAKAREILAALGIGIWENHPAARPAESALADRVETSATEPLIAQIDRLADFIMFEVPGEPSQSEGAVDCAIRVLTSQAQRIAELEAHLTGVLHEADWMIDKVVVNDAARESVRARLHRARTALKGGRDVSN